EITSGLVFQRGTLAGLPAGSGSGSCTPGSRYARATPVTTAWKTPLLVAVALVSLTLPRVGVLTVRLAAVTRMPSRRSSWSKSPSGSGKLVVSSTGAGSACPVETRVTIGEPPSSVSGGWVGSALGTYSCTSPRTCTRLPTAAAAGGAAPV